MPTYVDEQHPPHIDRTVFLRRCTKSNTAKRTWQVRTWLIEMRSALQWRHRTILRRGEPLKDALPRVDDKVPHAAVPCDDADKLAQRLIRVHRVHPWMAGSNLLPCISRPRGWFLLVLRGSDVGVPGQLTNTALDSHGDADSGAHGRGASRHALWLQHQRRAKTSRARHPVAGAPTVQVDLVVPTQQRALSQPQQSSLRSSISGFKIGRSCGGLCSLLVAPVDFVEV